MIYYFKYDINPNVFEGYSASHLFLSLNDVLCFSGHFQTGFKLNQGFGMWNLKDVLKKNVHRVDFSKDIVN